MQIIISQQTAKAVKNVISIIGGVATSVKNEDGSVNIKQCEEDLKKMGITPKQFNGLAHLAYQIENKLNNNPKKK